MRIGITCNIQGQSTGPESGSDDAQEEFDKPETVESIASVLRELGHEVTVLGDGRAMIERVLLDAPDFVFNFAEGTGVSRSREARVPAVLEMLGIPYSGSDPLALAATLDKDCTKRLAESAGVHTPKWTVVHAAQSLADASNVLQEFTYPIIIKPAYEGSSKGIRSKCLVDSPKELSVVVRELLETYRQPVLVEEFIAGDEVTVAVVGNQPPRVLGAMRIWPQRDGERDRFVYSLEVKRDWRQRVRYETPVQIEPAILNRIERAALATYRVLGCRDVSRLDFRVRDGVPYLLEVNPLPGLNPESGDIVLLAQGYGIGHRELVEMVFQAACARYGLESRTKNRNPSRIQ
jgi:D-alanine-D-alanine ligase